MAKKTYKTPNGKEIELYSKGFMVHARFLKGGELPATLAGSWTNQTQAEASIAIYLNDVEPVHIKERDEDGIIQTVKNPNKNKKES